MRQTESRRALERLSSSLRERRLLAENDALFDVRGELPLVLGVRLCDVDEREVHAVAKCRVEGRDVARPATKRRSGEAAEDE